jgi:hypothetical protein
MNRLFLTLMTLAMLMCAALPAWAKVTVKNKTDFKLDIVIKDTRQRQNQTLAANEKQSFQCTQSGGQLIVVKKGEEVVKTFFDDGDKFIITVDGEKLILKKDRDI